MSLFKIRRGPCGLHFFSRETGLNILLDELVPPKESWSRAPRNVSIALTNTCNLSCPHCYAPKHKAQLAPEQVLEWLAELDAEGCLSVGFGGGEPTMYPPFVELIRKAGKSFKLALTMTTNGHSFDKDAQKALTGYLNFVRISIDGVGKTYESIREKSFSSLIERIHEIRKLFPWGINVVVNATTFPDLNDMLRIAEDCQASELLLLPEVASGQGTAIDADTLEKLQEWAQCYSGHTRLTISEGLSKGFPICDPTDAETGTAAYVHIDADGVLKRTSFDSSGIKITRAGVIAALNELNEIQTEEMP